MMHQKKKVLDSALLNVKCTQKEMNPEVIPFEEYIGSPDTFIKIDLLDGRSLVELGFRSIVSPVEKYYIEFFDRHSTNDLMNYLQDSTSDFRVTSLNGTIIRMCQNDVSMIPDEIKSDPSMEPSKEYVFIKKKENVFQKLRDMIRKKDQ